ncbi:MAG TPA: immunoglobulin domain-containing protein, partial [Cyclobacteriaceae bacterium]|nr:immunoglobulin domain-containing protein [Cyclobacteriaceae bacterium]
MQRLYKALFLIIVCSVFAVNAAFSQCTLTGLNSSYCVDDASVTLSGGTAYYGPGVSGGVFYPSIAGVSGRPHKVFTTDGVATSYTVSTTGTYYPYTLSSSALSIANSSFTTVSLGFNFVYFGTTFSTVGIFDNGFIKFGGGSTSSTAQLIPNATIPNSEVAFAWNDLDPSTGTIRYQVFGSAPLRVFVVEYANVQFMGGGDYVTVQVHLFETSNHIEIHSTHNGSIGANKTMGIENSGGTVGVAVPGRNQSVWTADNDFVSFTPSCTVVKEVNVHALPNAALTVSPASTSICPSNTVGVTIGSSELGVNYQLLNNADNSALSGTFAGTGGNLVITSSALASSTVIKVRATNATTGCDVDLTNLSNITVNVPPQITVQPTATQTICVGQSVTFSVNAGVTTSPTYQWKKGGVDIVGATSSSYTIASVATTDAATYTVSVGGTCTPPVLSSNAVLNVNTLPAITTQPSATQTVCEGSAASFTVVATGTSPTYQWKKNGVDIVGATSATYNIATTATADAGTYTVVVSGTCSPSVTSTASVLNINEKPEIITQPTATQTVCVGQSVTFSVNAGVTTSPTYQWKKGGVDIVGATSSSYTIASVATGDAATYTVSVGGTCTPAVLSSNAVLNVNTLPAITTQPSATQTVCEGSAVSFTVVATGALLTYQWKKNGVDIAGATSATYNIATTATADAGTYTVVVSGTCSPSVTSNAAVLNINEQPEIITQPTATQTVCVGQSVTFSVNAGVTTSPTYQWKKGGVNIPGANSSTYTIASVVTADAATYTVSVGGTCTPAILSSNAVLNVNTLPAITTQPSATQTVCEGSAASFIVVASGTGVTYQWKKNGVDIVGATSATYNIATTATADAGTYTVVVSGTCSPSVTSTAAVLNINEQPEIITQPTATQTVCVGQSVTFSVNAGVTTSPTYQWKKGGVDIVGATSSSYTIVSVVTGDAATYTVSVGGTCTPAILSSNAVLNVNTLPAVTTQPSATQTVCEGSAVSFTVVATGTSLTYQWKKNGVDIAGATSATYNIATTATADAGTYTVVVSGTCSPSVTSNAAVLNINEQPEITTQPTATQTVCVGQSVTFSVNAGVTTSPTYQWKKGGVNIPGANSSSYTIAGVTTGDAATYTVSVGGTCTPAVLSSNAVLNVNTLPAITTQPLATQTVCEGSAASFTVVASGTGVTYQWKKNGVDIAGATSATYNIATTATADAGTYTVVVSGICSPSVTSTASVLNINEQPEIVTQPTATQTICVGQSVTFSVNAGVTTSPTYQWKKGGVNIPGANSSSYTIASVTTGDAATYTVSVGGTCTPAILSSNAVLNVNTLPSITTQPSATQTVCEGSAVSFTVVVSGTGVTYQWKKNGVDIVGATSATYNIATIATADAGTYTVVVSGICSPSVTSTASVLNINEQPEIVTQPTAT